MMNVPTSYTFLQKILAWSVHAFTASGLIAGFMAILAIGEGDWRTAMIWLIICLIIDGIDGTFARLFKVKEVLPYMDGKTIDFVVDFATYAIIPAYFFYEANLVNEAWNLPLTCLILLVSALYYGKDGMVTDDMYFVGFPVLWNMVVYYLIFITQLPDWGNIGVIIFFAILHFVPIKFVYPSQGQRFKWLTIIASLLFILALIMNVFFYPERNTIFISLAVLTALYYAVMAIYNTWIEG